MKFVYTVIFTASLQRVDGVVMLLHCIGGSFAWGECDRLAPSSFDEML